MNGNRSRVILAGILTWFIVVIPATAAATGGLATDPAVINVTGVTGGTQDMTMAFIANESIQNLKLVTLDLRDDSTSARIKARQITVANVPGNMSRNDINTTEVWFNFTGVGPGRYSGQLWFTYNDENKTTVPVKATVKMDWWPWPVIVLSFTLVTSFFLFYYRQNYKRRDEILKNLLVVDQKIRDDKNDLDWPYGPEGTDTGFLNPFGTALNRKSGLVREHLELDRIAEAETSYKGLLDCWARWVGEKYEWKKFFVVCADVLKRLTDEERRSLQFEIVGFPDMKLADARKKLDGFHPKTAREVVKEEQPAGFFEWLARMANNAYIAAVRLAVFEWASAFVTMGILIAFGMLTFYFNNPTFGASPVDLIFLALWGLFAGQLSEGVMKQVQGGVPALPKPPAS